jgi:hypothetical protein
MELPEFTDRKMIIKKKETIQKNTNIHSLYETIINYPQYTVSFEKYAKMDDIIAQWKLHSYRHIK